MKIKLSKFNKYNKASQQEQTRITKQPLDPQGLMGVLVRPSSLIPVVIDSDVY